MNAKRSVDSFKFLPTDSLGAADAVDDRTYLEDCFVDSGYLETLLDPNSVKSIIVGRTGAGKTALMLKVHEHSHKCSWINPEELSLQFLSNSTIIAFLEAQGVNLDLFYKLLWRHILVVELIRLRFDIKNSEDTKNVVSRFIEKSFGDRKKAEAIEYVREWGNAFWKGTEERIREITKNFENKVQSTLGSELSGAKLGAESAEGERSRSEVIDRAQEVVSGLQIGKLNLVYKTLGDEYFQDREKTYYVLIDRLDENWIEDRLRYKLIRALIDTVKEISRAFPTAKVVVSLRQDLLARVFKDIRGSGYQEEKYASYYLPIVWRQSDLKSVIESRLNKLIKHRYTGQAVTASDVLGSKVDGVSPIEFICERSMMRPRDVIEFVNHAIALSSSKGKISQTALKEAEREYARGRWRSLADEWYSEFPHLADFSRLFKTIPLSFKLGDLTEDVLRDEILEIAALRDNKKDLLVDLFNQYFSHELPLEDFRNRLFLEFYKLGIVGIKARPSDPLVWSFKDRNYFSPGDLNESTTVAVNPMFRTVFGSR